jgi:type I restriction enzyme, R subunit
MTPEQRTRQQIDLLLQQCGWIIQNRSQRNLAAGPGVAIRKALLKGGEADYLVFAEKAIATVEAKPEGYTVIGVEGQSEPGHKLLPGRTRIVPEPVTWAQRSVILPCR